MRIIPLAEYYEKHASQIEALLSASKTPSDPSLFLDAVAALAPVIKKHFPQYNVDSLIDDTLALLRVEMAPAPPNAMPVPGNDMGAGNT